jgi:hypothetical protein
MPSRIIHSPQAANTLPESRMDRRAGFMGSR